MSLLNAAEAAPRLGFRTAGALIAATKRHGIPHVRIGQTYRFDESSLQQYIDLLKRRALVCPTCGQHTRRLRRADQGMRAAS